MACVTIALFLFLNFFALNLRAEDAIIDCTTETSNHTLCLNFQNYSIDFCQDYIEKVLTTEDRNFIVDFHNTLRAKIAKGIIGKIPKGFYLKRLSWNPDLATLAQKWAEQCQTGKFSDFRLFHNQLLGRNVAIVDAKDSSKVNLEWLMEVWLSGLEHLTTEIINSYRKPTNRAFDFEPVSQMIWWNTSQIGCSRSVYKPVKCTTSQGNKTCARDRSIAQLVCTYFPVGNRAGEPVYSTIDSKRYICQYENNDILCTNIKRSERPTKRKDSYRDTLIHRMRDGFNDFWPVVMSCATSPNLEFLFYTYFLFFFIYFIH